MAMSTEWLCPSCNRRFWGNQVGSAQCPHCHPQPDSLDAAWAAAEAAVDQLNAKIAAELEPLGPWGGPKVYRFTPGPEPGPYGAMASPPGDTGSDGVYGYGSTPAGALRALTSKLLEA